MSDAKTDAVPFEKAETADPQRRNLALALLGALGGVGLLEACADGGGSGEIPQSAPVLPPEQLGHAQSAGTGAGSVVWFDKITDPTDIQVLKKVFGASANQVAVVQGYNAVGDGGGGIFWWDTSLSSGDDGGTIIVPIGSTTGRWRRLYSGPFNVRWFGAKGTDVSGNNDQPAFAAALAAIPNGGTVFVPNGIYRIQSPIVISAPDLVVDASAIKQVRLDVRIVGESTAVQIKAVYDAQQESVITMSGCAYCRVERLWLTSVGSSKAITAIYVHANQSNTIRNQIVDVKIGSGGGTISLEFEDGIQIASDVITDSQGTGDRNNEQHLIQNVHIDSCHGQGIHFVGCSMSNWNKIIGGSMYKCTRGIRCAGGNFVLFGMAFGVVDTVFNMAYLDESPNPLTPNYSVYLQRYPVLIVGARMESFTKIIDAPSVYGSKTVVRFVDLSCTGGEDPVVSFTSAPGGQLSFDGCTIGAGSPIKNINVSGTGVAGATILTITNSLMYVGNINLSNNAEGHFSGNDWVVGMNSPRVTTSTGATYTAIGEHGVITPKPTFGSDVPLCPPNTVPAAGQMYWDANAGRVLKIA